MFKKTYLSKSFHLYFIMAILLFLFFHFYFAFIISVIFYVFIFFAYRKGRVKHTQLAEVSNSMILAPVNGIIKKIQGPLSSTDYGEQLYRLVIDTNWKKETGLYLPLRSEIKGIIINKKNEQIFQGVLDYTHLKSKNVVSIGLVFLDQLKQKIILEFRRKPFGIWPRIWMMPGDRGRRGANIGHFPFGGKTILYLPENYEILINENEIVFAAETVLAGPKRTQ